MTNTLPWPTFDWKCSDQLRAWDIFQAKAELWLAGEKVEKEIQYTKIVLMLGDEGLSRWTTFILTDDNCEKPDVVFKTYKTAWAKIFPTAQHAQHYTTTSGKNKEKSQQSLIFDFHN